MTARRSLSNMRREAIFLENKGVCHLCERKIRVGEPWDVSHDRPLALLGEDGGDNLKVAHRTCHRVQTRTIDQPAIAKARRTSAKHIGAFKSARPMDGSRASRFKRKMNGQTELRR